MIVGKKELFFQFLIFFRQMNILFNARWRTYKGEYLPEDNSRTRKQILVRVRKKKKEVETVIIYIIYKYKFTVKKCHNTTTKT